jgi:hypothetical protein
VNAKIIHMQTLLQIHPNQGLRQRLRHMSDHDGLKHATNGLMMTDAHLNNLHDVLTEDDSKTIKKSTVREFLEPAMEQLRMARRSLSSSLYPILEYANSLLKYPDETPKLDIRTYDTKDLVNQLNQIDNVELTAQQKESGSGSFSTDYEALQNFLKYIARKHGKNLNLEYRFTPSKTTGIKSLDFSFPEDFKIDCVAGFAKIGLTGIGGEFGQMLLDDKKYFLSIPNLVGKSK